MDNKDRVIKTLQKAHAQGTDITQCFIRMTYPRQLKLPKLIRCHDMGDKYSVSVVIGNRDTAHWLIDKSEIIKQ